MNILFVVAMSLISRNSLAINKGVYGTDNRREIYSVKNVSMQEQALSVAAYISSKRLTPVKGGYKLSTKKLRESIPLCYGENYVDQSAVATCTGFLVAPNLLITAGHCMTEINSCTSLNKWVFDYQEGVFNPDKISSEDVYSCKKILGIQLDSDSKLDYAVIQLDRNVKGRVPLSYRKKGKINDYSSVYVIGHPSGLTAKFSDDAKVYENDNRIYFKADLDTFGGNSGSPIFNESTGVVEGILVRGDKDYVLDSSRTCLNVNRCRSISLECSSSGEEACKGESATRISLIPLDLYKIMAGNSLVQ